jgi:hypothetical protein
MNAVERFQALIRHPDYRKDAQLYTPTLKMRLMNFISERYAGLPFELLKWTNLKAGRGFTMTADRCSLLQGPR